MIKTTLSKRGYETSTGPSDRDDLNDIFENIYDPLHNIDGVVNIGIAENYVMLKEVAKFTESHKMEFSPQDFTYGEGGWGTRQFRTLLAKHITDYFNPVCSISADDILVSSGITALCEMLGFALFEPGDGLVISMPHYNGFIGDFELKAKVKLVTVEFGGNDQFSPDSVSAYEQAIIGAQNANTKVRALMLCNPHNPLGRCYPKSTIVEIMKLCRKYEIHLISDEVYALSIYDIPGEICTPFTSVLAIDHNEFIDPEYIHVLYGMSKDVACGGLRLGCIWTTNKELMKTLSAISLGHWAGKAAQKIATLILENKTWLNEFLRTSRTKLAQNSQMARKLLDLWST